MKLIRCYIENFGGLSDYKLSFNEGITLINEPNGFGKTTLAEFIKAMFYGLPRNSRDLVKSARTRYLPWQGGSFGGYLEFEFEGSVYRISRSFGATPRQDKFRLYEGENLRPSTRFSDRIGEELFMLDSDSFERSTYMPQLHSFDSMTTPGIQAKLSDLVEDTNDINNFDSAIDRLRKKRSGYVAFRGSGGSVDRAGAEISRLQTELDGLSSKPGLLIEGRQRRLALEQERGLKTAARDGIRSEITLASEAQSVKSVQEQYYAMLAEESSLREQAEQLKAQLPPTVPEPKELEALFPVFDGLGSLKADTPSENEAHEAEAVLTSLGERFEAGIPQELQIVEAEEKNRSYAALLSSCENLRLSDSDEAAFSALKEFFKNGVPEDDAAEACRMKLSRQQEIKNTIAARSTPPEERERYSRLQGFFAPGLPEKALLEEKKQSENKIERLRAENDNISNSQTAFVPEKSSPVPFILFLLAGIIAGAIGAVLLIKGSLIPGVLTLAAALILIFAALQINTKRLIKNEVGASGSGLGSGEKERIRQNNAEIELLQKALAEFCNTYIQSSESTREKLSQIELNLSIYIPLRDKIEEADRFISKSEAELSRLSGELKALLYPYFGDTEDFSSCISRLSQNLSDYMNLSRRSMELSERRRAAAAEYTGLEGEISAFLAGYFPNPQPEDFAALLRQLRREASEYTQAQRRLEAIRAAENAGKAKKAEYLKLIDGFNAKFHTALSEDSRSEVLKIRDCAAQYRELSARLEAKTRQREEFFALNSRPLSMETVEESKNIEALKLSETNLSDEIQALDREILKAESLIRELDRQVNEIPRLQDKLSALIEEKNEDSRNALLLDKTAEFLSEAKDALNESYLGPIKKSFSHYMSVLSGGAGDEALLDAELGVRLQRGGSARELGYFSIGQNDLVMLCMRLSLVDALFTKTKPFIILDDPFVNLDDEHTGEALRLLEELAEEHQIIYLVCNSSRAI